MGQPHYFSWRAAEAAGKSFNPGSTVQLRKLLYEQLKINITGRTKAGQPATDNPVLVRAGCKHEVARDIIHYRELDKVLGTYMTIPDAAGGSPGATRRAGPRC